MPKTAIKPAEYPRVIKAALSKQFPPGSITAYRYNPASVRVRVIDKRFSGMSIPRREETVLPLLRELPEEVQADLTVLLLLGPDEISASLMNREFDDPSRSMRSSE